MTDPTHILNWRRINDRITTSGQPSEAELEEIRTLGVTHVINLGPHHNKGALTDEPGTVKGLGMVYVYIPVDFESPSDTDFGVFRAALDSLAGQKVHVHCIYNARVSAFFYRLALEGGAVPLEFARNNMEGIWRPGRDWADFVRNPDAKTRPNTYAGEDY